MKLQASAPRLRASSSAPDSAPPARGFSSRFCTNDSSSGLGEFFVSSFPDRNICFRVPRRRASWRMPVRAAGTEMRCSRALGGSGAAELGAGASGRAAGRRGDDRKIEAVEVMAAPLAGAGASGAPPGVTGRLGAGMYSELVAVTGPVGRGVLGEAGTGTWLGTPEVRLGTGVVPCGGDRKGGGAGLRPPRLSFALLGARGRKITEVVPERCPCKPGVKGLAERLNMLGAEVEVPQPGRKGLGLATGAGEGLDGSRAASGGALCGRGGDCRPCPLSVATGTSWAGCWVMEAVRWRCCSKSWAPRPEASLSPRPSAVPGLGLASSMSR